MKWCIITFKALQFHTNQRVYLPYNGNRGGKVHIWFYVSAYRLCCDGWSAHTFLSIEQMMPHCLYTIDLTGYMGRSTTPIMADTT